MTDRASHLFPDFSSEWKLFRRHGADAVTVLIDHRDPVGLRLMTDFEFASIVAIGVEDANDLIAGFGMADLERVACHRYAFILDEIGEGAERRVVYRDKASEVRITQSHAVATWASTWEPMRNEA